MDIKTIHRRIEHEGLSFLTITLPQFGKDFEKSLDQGVVDRRLFTGFRWKGGLPRFLGGFLDHVFDRGTGRLLDDPSIDAILAVRQLSLLFSKVLLPCSDARVEAAMDAFIECEKDVRVADSCLSSSDIEDFRRVSAVLFERVFTRMDKDIHDLEVRPKHGPGTTADRLLGNQKFDLRTWTTRLERIFPSGEFLLPNWRYYDQLDEVDILEPGQELPVRVVPVPKTLKTPRIIAIEPTAMQYAQQGVLRVILDRLSEDKSLDKMIGFLDQSPNQEMARLGSSDGTLATIDLKEASDRVSNQLVRELVRRWPHLHEALDATRSRKADVPGHGVIRLAKFASMGSALCFPIEAIVFTTLIFIGIERVLNRPLRRSDIEILNDSVRVYGDDLIIPVDYVSSVVHVLESFGIRVNTAKSFWTGRFRESCGKEYYDGHDVSIVKVRRDFPTQRQDATGVVSLVSLRNQLYFAGYWGTVAWLDDHIRKIIRYFPVVDPSSPVQGRYSFLGYETQRMDPALHRPLVRGYVVHARIPQIPLDDTGALLKYLLKHPLYDENREEMDRKILRGLPVLGGQPSVDEGHLERSGRPQAVNLKLRWSSPF